MTLTGNVPFTPGAHVVHFHNDDDAFVATVAGYLAAALRENDAVVVIAGEAHRAVFESALVAAGHDVAAACRAGSFVVLDAADTLARFMVDGSPDAQLFEQVIGQLVRSAGCDGRAVRAYGEMVALLWQDGNLSGAVELERLWNALGDRLAFSLFCAYPQHLVTHAETGDAYSTLCNMHTDVVGGAPTSLDAETTRRFPAGPHSPSQARRFVNDTLTAWGRRDLIDDCVLVASELVTNAVLHARSDVTVALSRTVDGVTMVVGDASTNPPAVRATTSPAPGGRGLRLVDGLARGWGHRGAAGGKFVWADVASSGERAEVRDGHEG